MMNKGALLSVLLIIAGQSGAWFQQFAQTKYSWMRENLWVNIFLIGSLVSFAFVFAAKYGMDSFGSAWSYRLIQFSVGIFVFTYLTHVFLGETITTKNGICIGLSFLIILIQALWK
jgi:hypothetical protein